MTSPHALPENSVQIDNARFTLLESRLIRLEWAEDGVFEDRPTLRVVNRRTPPVSFEQTRDAETLCLRTGHCTLTYTRDGKPFSKQNLEIRFTMDGESVTWWPGKSDSQNLKGTAKTLDNHSADKCKIWVPVEEADPDKPVLEERAGGKRVFQGEWGTLDLDEGLVSRGGWAVVDESTSVVLDPERCDWQPWVCEREPGTRQDLYFLGYGRAYKDALREAQRLFGSQPLPPRPVLGYWYSRYWAYTDRELLRLVDEFDRMDLPLDVLVIDMDWHKAGWTGYSWDPVYFPDPAGLLRTLHRKGVHVTLNLHPADGVFDYEDAFPDMCREMGISHDDLPPLEPRFHPLYKNHRLDPAKGRRIPLDCCDPNYMRAYFTCLHHPLEKQGVDFWWMDWQQGNQGSRLPNLDTLPWINELHWRDQRRQRPDTRPVNFSRYGGIGAGRMPVGFSGDTHINWESLAFQPYFTATAANVLYGTWSHDIGGHMCGTLTPELYTRWIQFGVYSPILRTHASKSPDSERRVDHFPEPCRSLMMDLLRRREMLVPYIYGQLRQTAETGLSLVHPLYYEWPEHAEAYQHPGQYYFGDDLMVAPITRPVDPDTELAEQLVWLPPGEWIDTAHGTTLQGDREIRQHYRLEEIPIFVRPGAVIAEQGFTRRLNRPAYPEIHFRVYAGESGSGCLYEDDGKSLAWQRGESTNLRFEHHKEGTVRTLRLHPAEGDYQGFRSERTVRVILEGLPPPVHVSEGDWRYDGNTLGLHIDLGVRNLRQDHCIEIREAPSDWRELAEGAKGLFTRLEAVSQRVSQVSPTHPKHPDERLATFAAQTGRRIELHPDTFASEMRTLEQTLARLPEVLADMRRAHHDPRQDGETKSQQVLARVLRMLQASLAPESRPAPCGKDSQ